MVVVVGVGRLHSSVPFFLTGLGGCSYPSTSMSVPVARTPYRTTARRAGRTCDFARPNVECGAVRTGHFSVSERPAAVIAIKGFGYQLKGRAPVCPNGRFHLPHPRPSFLIH